MTRDVLRGLERLTGAALTGELAEQCARSGVNLMVLFGSAARPESSPADLDIAVRFAPGAQWDVLTVLDDLYHLTDFEQFDVMVLNGAGPVARERAMVGGRLLYQAGEGMFANEQIAAIMERMDTDEMRRVELELMAR